SGKQPRQGIRVEVPAQQPGQSHHHSANRRQQRQPVQPPLVRQRRQRQQRNRQRNHGVGEIELIVAVVQGLVVFLVLFGLQAQVLFLLGLIGGQLFVRRDGGAITLLLRGWSAGGGQLELGFRRLSHLFPDVARL